MSVVCLARDLEVAGRRVVIKILFDRAGLDASVIEKLKREMSALARLDHPGVGGVLDTGYTADGKLFLVTQYVEGVTLRSAVVPGGIDFARMANIIRRIGEALSVMHEKGIPHLDLKPENVMLTRHGDEESIRLLDFGMAGIRYARYCSDSASGLPGMSYLAPEQLTGKACVASDTYALGLIACELLTGKSPDSLRNPVAENAGGRRVLGQLRPDLSPEAERALLKATLFQPEDRQTSAREFSEELHRALTAEQSLGRAAPPGALEIAHVLFTDLVSFSMLSMDEQKEYLGELQRIVRGSAEVQRADAAGALISLPRGDGVALVFFGDPTAPVRCAVEVAGELKKRPHLRLRMGIHTGPVYRMADINANADVAGGAINTAQRVMDCGDAGHILLSKTLADVLLQLSQWSECLTNLGECTVKHGVKVHLYNFATAEAGNRELPRRLVLPAVSKTRSKALVAATLVSVAAAGAVVVWLAHTGRSLRTLQEASIAVLPFADMTPEKNQEYLSDGLAEELMNGLARTPGLRVAGRSSSFQFKGKSEDSRRIGEKLNVKTILEGSVRKQGRRVRIAVELVRAEDDSNVWSKTFDLEMNDVFAVEEEIARAVAQELRLGVLRIKTGRFAKSASTEAYDAYLQGQYFLGQRNSENLKKSQDYFQQSVKLDPDYPPAWVGIARAAYAQADSGYVPGDAGYRKAREAVNHALQLDPDMGDAWASLCWIRMHYDWNWSEASAACKRASTLEPGSVIALGSAGTLSFILGRWDDAISRYRRVVEIDPLNAVAFRNLGLNLYYAGLHDEANAAVKKALELTPFLAMAHGLLSLDYLSQGRLEAALDEAQAEKDPETRLQALALSNYALGRTEESDANLAELTSKYGGDAPFYISEVYSFRGETTQAFEWLAKSYEARDDGITEIKGDPLLKNVQRDPRFAALLGKMHLRPEIVRPPTTAPQDR